MHLPKTGQRTTGAAMVTIFKRFLDIFSDRTPEFWLNEVGFRRMAIFMALWCLLVIIALAGVNFLLQPDFLLLLPALLFLGGGVLAVCVWMWIDRESFLIPACILAFSLVCYASYMLFAQNFSPDTGMCMFVFLPPALMLTMGLRYAAYALALLLGLLVPSLFFLDLLPEYTLAYTIKVRFIYIFLMSSLFSGGLELVRHKTSSVLGSSLRQLKVDALTDPLTGLGNRRDFYSHISWMFNNAKRTGRPFALAMVDIDFFKKINDTYGHDVGDLVLLHLVSQIGYVIRGTDRFFRWGGEEFIVVMADTGPSEARFACERIRQHIQQNPYEEEDLFIPFTVSIGLHCSGANANVEDLISRTDHNLYAAKRNGRNRVHG